MKSNRTFVRTAAKDSIGRVLIETNELDARCYVGVLDAEAPKLTSPIYFSIDENQVEQEIVPVGTSTPLKWRLLSPAMTKAEAKEFLHSKEPSAC